MTIAPLHERILRRATHSGLELPPALVDGLAAYFLELARWNRTINLTALQLEEGGTDDAVDRLLIEPVLAARYIPDDARSLLDVGSGGGSPAIPMKLARPELALTMVEVKLRKSVFLRQVSRLLELTDTDVENTRVEALISRADLSEKKDVVSIRAVRLDSATLLAVQAFLRPGGRLLNFSSTPEPAQPPAPLTFNAVYPLVAGKQSHLVLIEKQTPTSRST